MTVKCQAKLRIAKRQVCLTVRNGWLKQAASLKRERAKGPDAPTA
ncbi:hypothetical protein JOE48_005045 [Methylobacterium sp. PvR107]|nr:hypothetical protein [Methylobacterium sp. PvR107]